MGEEDKFDERKQNLINWIKLPENFILVCIMIFAFAIRFHYFLMTKSQPLWWDEAVYGTLAKNMVLGGRWSETFLIIHETIIRPPLLPLAWALLLKFGFQEQAVRFFLELVPSIVSVFFVYLIGKDFYSKRVGLAAAFVFSVLWIHLFYTARILTNVPALAFLFSSIYYFMKSQRGKFNAKYFGVSIFLLSLSTLIRFPTGVVFFAYLLFLITTKKLSLLRNKKFWIASIIGFLPLLFFFASNYLNYGNIFPAFLGGDYLQPSGEKSSVPFGFHLLKFIPIYLRTSFFALFLIGLAYSLFEILVGYDVLTTNKRMKSNLLILLLFLTIYSFFIFYMKVAEDRWLMPLSITFVIFSGRGADIFYDFVAKYNKLLAIALVIVIFAFGAYQELTYADNIIKLKKESYLQMKQGFEWIKSISSPDDVILGTGTPPYTTYYAERNYLEFKNNMSEPELLKADYAVIHVFSHQPERYINLIQESPDSWQLINAYFFDSAKTKPAFVVYKRIKGT